MGRARDWSIEPTISSAFYVLQHFVNIQVVTALSTQLINKGKWAGNSNVFLPVCTHTITQNNSCPLLIPFSPIFLMPEVLLRAVIYDYFLIVLSIRCLKIVKHDLQMACFIQPTVQISTQFIIMFDKENHHQILTFKKLGN